MNDPEATQQQAEKQRPAILLFAGALDTTQRPIVQIGVDGLTQQAERLRAIRQEVVDALAKSMSDVGQLQPVVVSERGYSAYHLMAGWHRLGAGRKLGWKILQAVVLEDVDLDVARLAEIDENMALLAAAQVRQ